MRKIFYLIFLLFISCSQQGKKEEASIDIEGNYSIEGTKFIQAKLSVDQKLLAALDENRQLHILRLEDSMDKIIAQNIKEFLFSDEAVLYIKESFSPQKKSTLKAYNISDSVEIDLIDNARMLTGLKKIEGKIIVRQNNACRIFNNNFNDWETDLPDNYCCVVNGKLLLKNSKSHNDISEFADSVIWADKSNNLLVFYKKKSGTTLIIDDKIVEIGILLKPKFSPKGRFLSGVIEQYDDQRLINSEVKIFKILANGVKEIDRIKDAISIEWSEDESRIIVTRIDGSIQIKKFMGEE